MSQELDEIKNHVNPPRIINLNELVPNPKNPNKHPPEQIERFAKILKKNGIRRAMVVSNQSGFMTKGHGLLETLLYLGVENGPVDFQDYENDAMEYADMVADNELGRWARQDRSQINEDIGEFGPELDIELLGMQNFEVEPMDNFENSEIDTDNFGNDLQHTCPKCGFSFND